MCYERATDTSCVAGNRMILLDRLGETATICMNLTTTPYRRSRPISEEQDVLAEACDDKPSAWSADLRALGAQSRLL
jgi:hypothetical protein